MIGHDAAPISKAEGHHGLDLLGITMMEKKRVRALAMDGGSSANGGCV